MRPKDQAIANQLDSALSTVQSNGLQLPGIEDHTARRMFIEQLVESIRRIKYVEAIRTQELSPHRADPNSDLFDPIRAAVLSIQERRIDDAFWFVFLSVHFGKNRRTGWQLCRQVYGRLGKGLPWDWARTSADPEKFRDWLGKHQAELRGAFGNHRKYQSLDAYKPMGTGAAIESYIRWVGPPRTHSMLFADAVDKFGQNPTLAFDALYHSMQKVTSFGRTARFDYLTMIAKLRLASIEAGSPYLQGATGPLNGARLLLGGKVDAKLGYSQLEPLVIRVGNHLGVGMQVMEDALCNWQKSPSKFKPFRG